MAWARVGPLKTWDKLMKCLGALAETDRLACRGCPWDTHDMEHPPRRGATRADRGHRSSSQRKHGELWSSIDWHLKGHREGLPEKLQYWIERIIAERFLQRAPNYLPPAELRLLDDPVGFLTLMRHYGAPTRLLDWTESVWIAAYFACSGAVSNGPSGQPKKDKPGAIWVFDRFLLEERVKETCQSEVEKALRKNPDTGLPMFFDQQYPPWVSRLIKWGSRIPRIIVQHGSFTFAGKLGVNHAQAIDSLLPEKVSSGQVRKQVLLIGADLKNQVLRELDRMGLNGNSLFPGIDGVGRYLSEFARWAPLDKAVWLTAGSTPPESPRSCEDLA